MRYFDAQFGIGDTIYHIDGREVVESTIDGVLFNVDGPVYCIGPDAWHVDFETIVFAEDAYPTARSAKEELASRLGLDGNGKF